MTDVLTVCDAAGSERAALLGVSEGAPLCVLFAATHPTRTTAIILLSGFAREMVGPGHPWGNTREGLDAFLAEVRRDWGGAVGLDIRAPSRPIPGELGPLSPPRSQPGRRSGLGRDERGNR